MKRQICVLEAAMADFLLRGLREEGFTVEHAADGDDGWHALATQAWHFDIEDRRHSISNHHLTTIFIELEVLRTLFDDQRREMISRSCVFRNRDGDADRM